MSKSTGDNLSPFQLELMNAAEAIKHCEVFYLQECSYSEKKQRQKLCKEAYAKFCALVERAYCDECPLCGNWECIGCDG